MSETAPEGRLLTAEEVAAMFRVHPNSARRWGTSGRIGSILTGGGRRRMYPEAEVLALLRAGEEAGSPS